MAVSQFSVFSSADAGGPGLLLGNTTGEAIRILTACLVTGYVGPAAVNWTNPIATAANMASYRPPSGTRFYLVVGDDGAVPTLTGRAAYFTGWETLAGIATPVGSGSGQFPLPIQYNTVGASLCFKASAADAGGRNWQLFADAYGFYFFTETTLGGGGMSMAGFGDLYSASEVADNYRCLVTGNLVAATITSANNTSEWLGITELSTIALASTVANTGGTYSARTMGGGGSSVRLSRAGDGATYVRSGSGYGPMSGVLPLGGANQQFLSPIRLGETVSGGIYRGRMRGLWHSAHPGSNYTNGQVISGAGDYSGRTFQAVGPSLTGSFWFVETSNTVENN